MLSVLLLSATLVTGGGNGLSLEVTSETETIDPARSVFLTLTVTAPRDVTVKMPDLRERVRGFSQTEDFEDPVKTLNDGSTVHTVNWRLIPEPCAEQYKILPFVVTASPRLLSSQSDDGSLSFVSPPVKFSPPAPREPVTGAMECDPQKDLPPMSWRLVGYGAIVVLGVLAFLSLLVAGIRYLARRVKEHRMSPIERAWVELDRLLKKGLPGRGRYKDFYVELTMVVRRYVQRQHGVRAPHLTTEEFFDATRNSPTFPQSTLDLLIDFLRKADMVKFAGVVATPDTADSAAESARAYISKDDEIVHKKTEYARRHGELKK